MSKLGRHGSLALGATQEFETLAYCFAYGKPCDNYPDWYWRLQEAAGEVAPLMLVGVVKLASSLPVDSRFRIYTLDRKFMHLGFFISMMLDFNIEYRSCSPIGVRDFVFIGYGNRGTEFNGD